MADSRTIFKPTPSFFASIIMQFVTLYHKPGKLSAQENQSAELDNYIIWVLGDAMDPYKCIYPGI